MLFVAKKQKIILFFSTIVSLIIILLNGILEFKKISDTFQISYKSIIFFISIFVNILSIIFIIKNINTHKKKIVVFNIIQLLGSTTIPNIPAILNIIILASNKKNENHGIKEKQELPILEDITKHKWYVYFIIFILYIIYFMLPTPNSKAAVLITYLMQILILVIPVIHEIKRDFIVFKDNFKLYLKKTLPRFLAILIIYFISSTCINALTNNIANNEAGLRNIPLYISALFTIVVAPIIEELVFRVFMKKFIKNNILFITLSSIIFGALHVLPTNDLLQLLYIIPYSIAGFALSLNYIKTKNIVSNLFLHCTWNAFLVILQLLVG